MLAGWIVDITTEDHAVVPLVIAFGIAAGFWTFVLVFVRFLYPFKIGGYGGTVYAFRQPRPPFPAVGAAAMPLFPPAAAAGLQYRGPLMQQYAVPYGSVFTR